MFGMPAKFPTLLKVTAGLGLLFFLIGVGIKVYQHWEETRLRPITEVWGVKLGDSKQEVLFQKGKPESVEDNYFLLDFAFKKPVSALIYKSSGDSNFIYIDDQQEVVAVYADYQFPFGFDRSTTLEEVQKKLGEADHVEHWNDGIGRWLVYRTLNGAFFYSLLTNELFLQV